jgi:biopolymer transport protein ExbD/biopolymer transport protein TolR
MKRQTFNDINITPLTDIFLVLLILMMVIAPILDQQGLSLAVPEFVETNQVNKDAKILTVQVTKDNRYLINDEQIDESNLLETLKEQSKINKDGILIQANGDSDHEAVVRLMDNARNAGVQSISIVEM